MERKLCPLSFGFVIPGKRLPGLIPGQDKVQLTVGMPCIEFRCEWFYEVSLRCIVWEILEQLPGPPKKETGK